MSCSYTCKRCSFTSKQKNVMRRHLEKKKKCLIKDPENKLSDIELYNFSSEEVTISFTQTGEVKGIINPVSSVTLKPKQTSKITLKTNDDKVDDFAPSAGVGLTGDKTYRGSFVAKSNKSTQPIGLSESETQITKRNCLASNISL